MFETKKNREIGTDNPKTFFSYFLGRVINNVFVPANAVVPEPVNVRQPKEIVMITGSSMQQPQLARQPKQFDFDDFYKGREPQRRMRDNMAIESRSDQVYVKPPADFSVSSWQNILAGNNEKIR